MSFVINPTTLNIMCLFGICPYKYNPSTQTIDCCFYRLVYLGVYFVITSVTQDCKLIMYYSTKTIDVGVITYEITKIVENTSRSIIHNLCIIHILLRRRSYVKFLNDLNNFQRNLESDSGFKINSKLEHFRSLAIISALIAYTALISVVTYIINRSHLPYSVLFWYFNGFLKQLSYWLVIVDICILNTVLLRRYGHVYEIISSSINNGDETVGGDNKTAKRIFKSFERLEQLNDMKLKFSNLFGPQILLIVSFYFVVMTIAIYFSLFPSIILHNKDLFSTIYFVLFNTPCVVILCWMVVLMDELGQQVNEMKKYAVKACAITDNRLSASIDLFFLKLQRMDKQKYVTASDLFAVNYRMLYNISTAIITHMMIIIQFQQWEDSQKSEASLNQPNENVH